MELPPGMAIVRQTCHEINEPIIARLDRLSTDIPINVEVLDDVVTRLELLE